MNTSGVNDLRHARWLARPLLSCRAVAHSPLSRLTVSSLPTLQRRPLEMNLKTAGIALAAGALLTTSAFAAATKQVVHEQRLQSMVPKIAKSLNDGELVPTG